MWDILDAGRWMQHYLDEVAPSVHLNYHLHHVWATCVDKGFLRSAKLSELLALHHVIRLSSYEQQAQNDPVTAGHQLIIKLCPLG